MSLLLNVTVSAAMSTDPPIPGVLIGPLTTTVWLVREIAPFPASRAAPLLLLRTIWPPPVVDCTATTDLPVVAADVKVISPVCATLPNVIVPV